MNGQGRKRSTGRTARGWRAIAAACGAVLTFGLLPALPAQAAALPKVTVQIAMDPSANANLSSYLVGFCAGGGIDPYLQSCGDNTNFQIVLGNAYTHVGPGNPIGTVELTPGEYQAGFAEEFSADYPGGLVTIPDSPDVVCRFSTNWAPVCSVQPQTVATSSDRVSVHLDGSQTTDQYDTCRYDVMSFAHSACRWSLSADGNHVAFSAPDTRMGFTPPSGYEGTYCGNLGGYGISVYLWDKGDATPHRMPTLVTSGSYGDAQMYQTIQCASQPAISGDGRYVAFVSWWQEPWEWPLARSELYQYPGKQYPGSRIYVLDRDPDGNGVFDEPGRTTTTLVSQPATPGVVTEHAFTSAWAGQIDAFWPSISADGRYLSYTAANPELAATRSDTNCGQDTESFEQLGTCNTATYFHDRDSDGNGIFDEPGKVENRMVATSGADSYMSAATDGPVTVTTNQSHPTQVSDDGNSITFTTTDSLVPQDTGWNNGVDRVPTLDRYIWRRATNDVVMVAPGYDANSVSPDTGGAFDLPMSPSGRFVVFAAYDGTGTMWGGDGATGNNVYVLDRDPDGNGILDEGGSAPRIVMLGTPNYSNLDNHLSITDDGVIAMFGPVTFFDPNSYLSDTAAIGLLAPGDAHPRVATRITTNDSELSYWDVDWHRNAMLLDAHATTLLSPSSLGHVPADTNGFWDLYRYDLGGSTQAIATSLSTDVSTTEPGATGVNIADIPTDRLRALAFDPSTAPSGTRLRPSGTRLRPSGTRLRPSGTRLRDAQQSTLASLAPRLRLVPAAGAAPLSQLAVRADGGWPALLAGTSLSGLPVQSISIGQVLDLLAAGVSPTSPLGELTLADLDLANSPLAAISSVGLELGSTPVRNLTTTDGSPWCTTFESVTTVSCASIGVADPSSVSLMELDLQPGVAKLLDANPTLRRIDIGANLMVLAMAAAPVLDSSLNDLNLAVSAIGLVPLTTAVTGSPALRSIAVSTLSSTQRDRTIDCSGSFDCTSGTLGEASAAGVILPGATLADMGGRFGNLGVGDLGTASLVGVLVDDVVRGYLDAIDFPWENLDLTTAGLQEFATNPNTVTADLRFVVSSDAPVTAQATLTLPPGFRVDPQVRLDRDPIRVLLPDDQASGIVPTVLQRTYDASGGTLLVSIPGVQPGQEYHLSVRTIASLRLGTATFGGSVAAGGRIGNAAPQDVEVVAPADTGSTAASGDAIDANRLVFGYFDGTSDVDMFHFSPKASDTIVGVRLTNLGDDGDLVLYGPPDTAGSDVASRRVGAQPIPIGDLPLDPSAANSASDPGANGNAPVNPPDGTTVLGSSTTPGVTDQEAASAAGAQYIQVSAYDRYSARQDPYMVRVREEESVAAPSCSAGSHPYSGSPGTMPDLSALPGGTRTIILVNEQRLREQYPTTEVDALLAKLATLAADSSVQGVVIPVEASDPSASGLAGYPNIAGAFSALAASPCDVDRANAVVARITKLVDGIRTGSLPGVGAHRDLANVVVVGNDAIIPQARITDSTRAGNESTYAAAFDATSPIGAALASQHFLTDAPYGDTDPIQWLNRRLYVEDLAVGRLVDTPQQMSDQVDAYLNRSGHALDPSKAFVAGYDWMTAGANSAAGALATSLTAANGGTTVTPTTLESETWDKANLLSGAGSIGATQPTVTGLYMHADHLHGVTAVGAAATGETFTPTELASALPTGSKLVFSMGCHSGLNDPASTGDFPETIAGGGAVYIAATGYGYGDDSGIQLHDRVVRYLAGRLNGANTVGDALVGAKQDYFSTQGVYGEYDDKVLETMTLYGLPMYRVGTSPVPVAPPSDVTPTSYGAAPVARGPVGPAAPTSVGISHASFDYTTGGGASADVTMAGALDAHSSTDGNWYEVHGYLPLTVPGRPVQPRTDHDVTARSSGSLLPAHGALITDLTEQGSPLTNFDAAWARATIDAASAAPELVAGDVAFPDRLATLSTYSDPSGARLTADGPKLRQRLVLAPGRFVSDPSAAPGRGTQTLFSHVGGEVLYSSSDDYTEPTVSSTEATVDPSSGATTYTVATADASGVRQAVVLYRDDTGWHSLDLADGGDGTWSGDATPTAASGTSQYFVQVVDEAGNVAVSANKGALAIAAPDPEVTIDGTTVVETRNGTTTATVTVRLSRPSVKPVVVDWRAADGTATVAAGDFQAASGRLTFSPGETEQSVTVVVGAASADEDDEAFTIELSNPVDGTIAQASGVVTVVSPFSLAPKGISVSDASVAEGDAKNGTLRFVVSLDAPQNHPVSVSVATEDGTAVGAAKPTGGATDYKSLSPKTVVFSPGQVAKAVSILVAPDAVAEGDDTMHLVLSNASGMDIGRRTGTGTIIDDDPVAGNPMRTGDVTIVEGDSKARPVFVTVRFAAPLAAGTSISYTTRDGTATGATKPKGQPGDYLVRARSLYLKAGATSFVIPITLLPDTTHEGNESFDVLIDGPDGQIRSTVNIVDDE